MYTATACCEVLRIVLLYSLQNIRSVVSYSEAIEMEELKKTLFVFCGPVHEWKCFIIAR